MAKAGRPPGAVNLDKPYKEALRRALARAESGKNPHTLDKIAEQHLIAAYGGDMNAIKELANRLDGKSSQETNVNINDKREASDWSRDELVRIIDGYRRGDAAPEGRRGKQLN